MSIESISDKRLSLNGGFENRHTKLDTRSRKIPGTETWTNPKKSGPGDSWLNYKKGQITGPMRKYLEPGIAYKEAGAKKTFRKLRHQVRNLFILSLFRTFCLFAISVPFISQDD